MVSTLLFLRWSSRWTRRNRFFQGIGQRAIAKGYLSVDMYLQHILAYSELHREGETNCRICGKWVTDNGSEKCDCSLRQETLSKCDSRRKALARGKKPLWSLGAQPGKMVWHPYDNPQKI